jgi:hypothetical protein
MMGGQSSVELKRGFTLLSSTCKLPAQTRSREADSNIGEAKREP